LFSHQRKEAVMTVDEEQKAGEEIVKLLNLKRNRQKRFNTSGGDKTEVGLCRSIKRIFSEQGDMG
jgi:hypothetical protein